MEYNNKAKTAGTKEQQTHRTQEWTRYGGWEGRDKGIKGHHDYCHTKYRGGMRKAVYIAHRRQAVTL